MKIPCVEDFSLSCACEPAGSTNLDIPDVSLTGYRPIENRQFKKENTEAVISAKKMNIGNIKAATRVSIGFSLISILLVAGTALGIGRMAHIKKSLDDINANNARSTLALVMHLTVTERALAMRNLILLTRDTDIPAEIKHAEVQREIERIKEQAEKYAVAERKLSEMFATLPNTTSEEKSKLEQIREVSVSADPFIREAKELALAGKSEAAYRLLRFEFRSTQRKWWSLLRELIAIEENRNSNATIEANHAYDYGRTLMLTFGGAAFLFSIAAAYLITRTEKRLQASEQAFRTLVENSPDMIVRFDKHYRRVLINPAYYRETGIAQGADQNKTPDESWWKANISGDEYKAKLRQVMETGIPTDILMEWEKPDRQLISHSVRIVPEHNPSGEIIGTLAIGRNITDLREAERRLKQSHAQLHELSVHREVVQEEERKSIARELHDELGQILTALHMNVSVLRLKFGKANPPLMEHVKTLAKMVETTMQVVRRVVSSLRPTALDMGIVSALEWLAEEFTLHSGIDCKLTVEEKEIALDETRALAIFRIVQESLTNVARHAQASQVGIVLKRQNAAYFLMVRDNGKGFDPAVPKPKSFGLAGVRERVFTLGGELTVFSTAGHGTSIEVHLPINEISVCP